jgi:IAA-amino acid hydrolase
MVPSFRQRVQQLLACTGSPKWLVATAFITTLATAVLLLAAHMTMLLGAAKLLKSREAELQGTVLLVFQPAEEGGAGGDKMIQEGAIEGASAAFGMHVWPISPTGTLALRAGTIMAASLTLEVFIKGRGGHAAVPHANIDPVPAAAAVVLALQTLVSRETSPLGSAVLSITQLQVSPGVCGP